MDFPRYLSLKPCSSFKLLIHSVQPRGYLSLAFLFTWCVFDTPFSFACEDTDVLPGKRHPSHCTPSAQYQRLCLSNALRWLIPSRSCCGSSKVCMEKSQRCKATRREIHHEWALGHQPTSQVNICTIFSYSHYLITRFTIQLCR